MKHPADFKKALKHQHKLNVLNNNLQWMSINKFHHHSMSIKVYWPWDWIAIIMQSLETTQHKWAWLLNSIQLFMWSGISQAEAIAERA